MRIFFEKCNLYMVLMSIAFFTGVTSCDTTEEPDHGTIITILSPAENAVFTSGQEVLFEAEINANVSIHGYVLREKNLTTGNVNIITERHTHGTKIQAGFNWIPDMNEKGDIELEFTVLVNHEGLSVKNSRKVKYQ